MYKVVIIGTGQLGSRHLQGLKLAQLPMSIWVVDPSCESLRVAMERYNEVSYNSNIVSCEFVDNLDLLPHELDLVIVATNSTPRLNIIERLLSTKNVKNLVLEKFLFPALSNYQKAEKLLLNNGLLGNTWVNCPRRLWTGYQKLRNELCGASCIEFTAKGNDWGLACNGIHLIDMFAYLKGDVELSILDTLGLDKFLYPSKRDGYFELMGTLAVSDNCGNSAVISSLHGTPGALVLEVRSDEHVYLIDEMAGTITRDDELFADLGLRYQSALTGEMAEQILLRNCSDLTSYSDSARLHQYFLQSVVAFYNNHSGKQGDDCPIT